MNCCGQHKRRDGSTEPASDRPERKILPDDPCVFCAYKHFHTARRLVQEYGYTAENRGDAVGELVLGAWHLWKTENIRLAEKVRDIRHKIEHRRESEVDWGPATDEFDLLIKAEASKK